MKRFFCSYWGDVVCGILFIITGFVFVQVAESWFFEENFVLGVLIACIVFIFIALVNLIRLKKRALRDWIYPLYGILFALITLFYTFAANPWHPMNAITGRAAAADTFLVTVLFLLITAIVRGALRLAKRI